MKRRDFLKRSALSALVASPACRLFGAVPSLPTTGLVARYEPAGITQSGGLLTGWTDSAGTNHVTSVPSAPAVLTVNGRTTVRFTAGNYFQIPTSVSFDPRSMSVFAVTRPIRSGTYKFLVSPGAGLKSAFYNQNDYLGVYAGGTKDSTLNVLTNRTLQGCRFSATFAKVSADGEEQSMSVNGTGAETGADIGRWSNGGGLTYSGDLEALFIYSASISDGDFAQLREYVVNTYGVGTPDKNTFIVAAGDSLTAGAGLSTPAYDINWLSQMSNLAVSWPKQINQAVSGQTIATMLGGVSSQVSPFVSVAITAGYRQVWALVWGGTNDLSNNDSAATVLSNISAWCAAVKSANPTCKTIVCSTIARGTFNGTQETNRLSLNASLRSGWAGFAERFVDLAADPRLSNASDTTYFQGDTIHTTQAGHAVCASLIYPAIFGSANRWI